MKKNIEYIFVYNGKRYLIVDLHFNYSQKQEQYSGKPITVPWHSPILLYLKPMGKNKDRELVQQYVSKRLFEGHIEFLIVEDGIENRLMRHLEFANAKLTRFGIATKYPGHEGKDILRIEISPYIVKHGDTITEWPCNPSNPFKERTTPVLSRADFEEEQARGQINKSYFEDEEGNPIKDLEEGEEVYYILNTRGLKGKYVDIDFSDNKIDFEYEGKPLKDDILKELYVSSSKMKIPLTIIKQKQ